MFFVGLIPCVNYFLAFFARLLVTAKKLGLPWEVILYSILCYEIFLVINVEEYMMKGGVSVNMISNMPEKT